ncbi:hypothetical protein ZIOFF_042471 [Zingiber officinale]|uniref:Protein FAR1-RELATED SEQUENCE n=1 Tax=Zingiber officinale TaxID=94328 RepID=A0A8J5KXX9_ZINOF|nr:hypothetical protein ZIOFF_042471 [Zingiber officinale]
MESGSEGDKLIEDYVECSMSLDAAAHPCENGNSSLATHSEDLSNISVGIIIQPIKDLASISIVASDTATLLRQNAFGEGGNAHGLLDYFKRMQADNPAFFYSIQVDNNIETWLAAMDGRPPVSLVTDQNRAMAAAITKVFPTPAIDFASGSF